MEISSSEKYAYVAGEHVLTIINISDLGKPVVIGSKEDMKNVYSLSILDDNNLIIADCSNNYVLVDILRMF